MTSIQDVCIYGARDLIEIKPNLSLVSVLKHFDIKIKCIKCLCWGNAMICIIYCTFFWNVAVLARTTSIKRF